MKLKFLPFVIALAVLVSCKKSSDDDNNNPGGPGGGGGGTPTLAEKIKDTVVLFSQDIYLWYNQIPSNFNGRSYADPDAIMKAIRNYSNEPGFTQPVDRWSFAVTKTEWDNVSSGSSLDFGMNAFFYEEGDLRVRYVEPASPAGLAGIQRGWRFTKVNNITNITTSNGTALSNAIYNNNTGNFTFTKPDGSSVDISLAAGAYQTHPVFLDSVYTLGPKKLGYMVFNSFLGDTTEIISEFQQIFSKFASENVDDVAIDLRYNGGGYVNLQDQLANYLINTAANGQPMMSEEFNDQYSNFNETTIFNKKGTLNLNRVFVIVSENTASASELLINNLKPFMNVILVGPSATYGKPVGYFPIGVGDWYIFPVSFRSTNSNGDGNYFDGFPPNNEVEDGLNKNWGDIDESAFASVVKYVTTGAFRPSGEQRFIADPQVVNANQRLVGHSFKGMVGAKRSLK